MSWGDIFAGVLALAGRPRPEAPASSEAAEAPSAEMMRSVEVLEAQLASIRTQGFEASFFQMLALHNQIVNGIDLVDEDRRTVEVGRDALRLFYARLGRFYRDRKARRNARETDDRTLAISYYLFWKAAQGDLAHYYRYLLSIIDYVTASERSQGPYIGLLRAQLSDQELLLLFYHCLTAQGAEFRIRAEAFALFEDLPIARLLERSHQRMIGTAAFGPRMAG